MQHLDILQNMELFLYKKRNVCYNKENGGGV